MWPLQRENILTVCATTADNVIPITSCKRIGADLKSAQKTTNQKSPNLSPSSLAEMQLHFMNLAQIGLNQSLFMLVHLATLPFKVLGVLTAGQTCGPIRNKEMCSG